MSTTIQQAPAKAEQTKGALYKKTRQGEEIVFGQEWEKISFGDFRLREDTEEGLFIATHPDAYAHDKSAFYYIYILKRDGDSGRIEIFGILIPETSDRALVANRLRELFGPNTSLHCFRDCPNPELSWFRRA